MLATTAKNSNTFSMTILRHNGNQLKRRRASAFALTVIVAVTIGILTLVPEGPKSGVPGSDKVHHFLAFAALILPCAALYPQALFKGVLAATFYGGLIEIIQPYFGRSGELADFVADVSGIGAGAALGLIVHSVLNRALPESGQRRTHHMVKSYANGRPENLPVANSDP
ncbi:VanZ family protein [Pontibaca salina]|uniref:VanZ-like domain-containing protein n=1 Tax=Pontibaca salina TaxID=2795731 RepID=A0A934LZ45_9RHOB|nr:hypothetical protein [Pontibaca salina]MBI6630507.1 hypothetical protein [Pontibaca salina]